MQGVHERGNIEWLIELDSNLSRALTHDATDYVCKQGDVAQLREKLGQHVERYNSHAATTSKPTVAPHEIEDFAKEIVTYFFNKRTK